MVEAISKKGFWVNPPEVYPPLAGGQVASKADKNRGGTEFQPAGIHQYFEDLKKGTNKEFGPKDFFEIASYSISLSYSARFSKPSRSSSVIFLPSTRMSCWPESLAKIRDRVSGIVPKILAS
jgi:hypothetical protein